MAINKYFRSGESYNADELNRIVAFLRTDGAYGEIENSLKVVATTGTTVNIFKGIGWRDGCMIELTTTEPYTLPSENGTYSVCIQLTKAGDTVTDIAIGHEAGEVSENYVLAWVTVSGGSIANIEDRRVNSTFKGATQILTGTADWEAGDHVLFSEGESNKVYTPSWQKRGSYRMGNNGVVRIKFDLYFSGSFSGSLYSMSGMIYKNGVAVGVERITTSGTYVTFSEDFSVSAGDVMELYVQGSGRFNNLQFCISRGSDIIQKVEG